MLSVKKYTWLLHVGTIAVCAYFVSQAVSTYVASFLEIETAEVGTKKAPLATESEQAKAVEDYQVIADRNIFNSAASGAEVAAAPGEEINPADLGEAVKTNLDISLLGTLMIGEGTDRRSSALVAMGKGKGAKAYFVGGEESFGTNVKLTKVEKGRVEFINGNRLEYAELEEASKKSIFASRDEVFGTEDGKDKKTADNKPEPAEAIESKVVIEQKELDDALANLDRLYSEIRIVPSPKGLKLLSVKPGSIVSKLGVRRGDVLEKINGSDFNMQKGMELFSQLKDMKNFTVDLVREGQNKTIQYEIR